MATLQRIRNRAGLLVAVIIGMAIFAFVLQDLLSGGKTAFARSKFTFAEIDGTSVQYDEYAARVEKLSEYYRLRMGQTSLDEQTMESIREQTWQDMVREYVTQDEYKELGIAVSTDEMMDMVQGQEPASCHQESFFRSPDRDPEPDLSGAIHPDHERRSLWCPENHLALSRKRDHERPCLFKVQQPDSQGIVHYRAGG